MKNILGKSFYSILWIILLTQNIVSASAFDVTSNSEAGKLKWNSWDNMVTIIESIVAYVVWLLYLIAVIVVLYWGFLILTAGWDEEWVKKWKKAIVNGAIWLVVIFLASSLVTWLVGLFWWTGSATWGTAYIQNLFI